MPRLEHDAYMTPPHYIAPLISEINIYGKVFEPCSGDGAIAAALSGVGAVRGVVTNDIDPERYAHLHIDARGPQAFGAKFDWIVTNPPFSDELAILDNALEACPNVAFLARISFLEPTAEREYLLESRPPKRVIYLPRYSFRLNDEGKKATDNVTCCWMVWGEQVEPGISVWGKGKAHAVATMRDLL